MTKYTLINATVAEDEGVSRELSLHPVHLTRDKKDELPPSALVPFCSYQSDHKLLGEEIPDLNLTICNKFKPIILEGQLCYTLDVAKLTKMSTKAGKPNGLFLLLDPNPYRLNGSDDQADEEGKLKVYVHTLAQFSKYGAGALALTSLKKMEGTKSFKELPDNQKRCSVHNREECQTKNFLGQVLRKCKCVPWALMVDTSLKKVGNAFIIN